MAFSSESNIQRADPSTIHKKVLTGYQGWFTCHGDGEPISPGHHGWLHWFGHPVPDGGTVNTDLWPDMSAYSPSELYAAPGFRNPDGSQAHLFSSRNPKTVQRHFRWMAENGMDGLFLQRFVGQCDMERDNAGIRRIRDEIGDVVKSSAEKEGRVFAIMYDLAGVDAERTQRIIEHDWNHLLHVKRILDSPNYLRENGRPVIAIWGFGFEWKERAPAVMKAVTDFIRRVTPGGAYIMVGTPSHWRADHLEKHPDLPPAFMRCFDAICPWTIGLFSDAGGSDHYYEHIMQRDIEYIQQWEQDTGKRVDFIPTVHPGGSGYNVSEGNWKRNGAPRHGGKYLWRQFYNTIGRLGVHTVYAAMWDEYNEGTNFLPAIAKASQLPYDESGRFQFIAYDVDGYDLPSDWYMRIAGYAAETLKGEHKMGDAFPERELREWKRTHPRLERRAANASGSAEHSYQQWSAAGETFGNDEEQPPPPYTLEADATCDPVEAREPLASDSTPARSEPPLPSASTRPDPPPAPLNTRPAPPPLPASTRPQAPRVQQNNRPDVYQDTVSSLTDDLRRHSITSSPSQFADSAPGHVPSPVPSLAGSRHSPSPGPPTSHEVPSQWPPPEWNVGITPTHGSSRPHDYNSPAYPTYQSSTSYTPGRTSRPSVSSYPGMRTDSRSPSNMPAGPPSPGFKPPSPALIPPSPYGMPTTPPPHGPSMPEAPKPSMSVPGDSFVGGFHETPAGSGYEPVYAPPPGPPPGTQLDPPFGPPPVHPQAARPGLPPPPPPRLGSEQPPSLSASHYPPPSRTGDSRPGPSGVQGYAQNAMGYAGGAIGRLAGDRRKILEKGVEDLASAGSKLFGRFK